MGHERMHFVAVALALETFLVNFHLQIVTDRYSPGVVLDQHPNLTKKTPKKDALADHYRSLQSGSIFRI